MQAGIHGVRCRRCVVLLRRYCILYRGAPLRKQPKGATRLRVPRHTCSALNAGSGDPSAAYAESADARAVYAGTNDPSALNAGSGDHSAAYAESADARADYAGTGDPSALNAGWRKTFS